MYHRTKETPHKELRILSTVDFRFVEDTNFATLNKYKQILESEQLWFLACDALVFTPKERLNEHIKAT
jgi:hypothetical protein